MHLLVVLEYGELIIFSKKLFDLPNYFNDFTYFFFFLLKFEYVYLSNLGEKRRIVKYRFPVKLWCIMTRPNYVLVHVWFASHAACFLQLGKLQLTIYNVFLTFDFLSFASLICN